MPVGRYWISLLTQPVRVSGIRNEVHACILSSLRLRLVGVVHEPASVTLQKGMSPVKQVLQEHHVKPAASTSLVSETPAWFAAYKQEVDQKCLDQKEVIEQNKQQSEEIKQQPEGIKQQINRLNRFVQANEDIDIRSLKEGARS